MKKFYISIPEPCREDWSQMSPTEKGRFCASCQKTVVDFTHMSDRELVAFFKKPAASVCGRFHQDQLNREVAIPKKRISWLKYFFTVSLPAFMVSLTSCNTKDRLTGDVDVTSALTKPQEVTTIGMMLTPIEETTASESVSTGLIAPLMGKPVRGSDDIGKLEIIVGETINTIDTTQQNTIDTAFNESCSKQLDTVMVKSIINRNSLVGVVGGISIRTVAQPAIELMPDRKTVNEAAITIFPNPVKAGRSITIEFANEKDIPAQVQVITASGQSLAIQQISHSVGVSSTKITMPYNVATGIYFVHMVYQSGRVEKSSFMVSR